ncbi:MAG: hypothetical protein ABF242_01125 [Flavobacteriales bacterium]
MIKQSIKDDIIFLSIANRDFSYRIPLAKIGAAIDWKIGQKGGEEIVIENVSKWTIQLFTKATAEQKHVKQFVEIVQEHSPNNNIDWKNTKTAVNAQNQYNWLVETNKTAKKKQTSEEIIESLKKKFNLE